MTGQALNIFKRAFALLAVMVLAQTLGFAELQLQGDTSSSYFGTPGKTEWQELSFLSNAFDVTTLGGTAALTGADKLGSFVLGPSEDCYDVYLGEDRFTLRFNFTLPQGLFSQPDFTADILGLVTRYGGFAVLFFDNSYQDFNYQTPEGSGSFRLSLAPDPFLGTGALTVWSGSGVDLNARVENAVFTPGPVQVPEPEAIVLLLTMLSGVAFWHRKHLRQAIR